MDKRFYITFHFVGDITLQLSIDATKNKFEEWEKTIRNDMARGKVTEIKDDYATHTINYSHVLFVSLKWVEELSDGD